MADPGWRSSWDSDHEQEYYSHFVVISCRTESLLLFSSEESKEEDLQFGREIAAALNDAGILAPSPTDKKLKP